MSRLFPLVTLIFLTGCAFTPDTMLVGAEDVPEGTCMFNCFDWSAQSGGFFTNSSAQGEGCVCVTVAGEGADCPRETTVQTPSGCEAGFMYEEAVEE